MSKLTLEQRFWHRVNKVPSGCWQWTGAKRFGGYGQFTIGNTHYQAHRVSYELFVGTIPDGLQLDHLCRNRGCVNPAHLEPVTQSENAKRGLTGKHPSNIYNQLAARTECNQGHPFDLFNTHYRSDNGTRRCLECQRAWSKASKQKRQQVSALPVN